jgi:hypothetical protein
MMFIILEIMNYSGALRSFVIFFHHISIFPHINSKYVMITNLEYKKI